MMRRLHPEIFLFNAFLLADYLSTLLILGVSSSFYEANPLIILIGHLYSLFTPYWSHITVFFLIILVSVNFMAFRIRKSLKKVWWFRGFLAYWCMLLLWNTANNVYFYAVTVGVI